MENGGKRMTTKNLARSAQVNEGARGAYEWAQLDPNRIALVTRDVAVSYGELIHRSNMISHHLRGLGLGLGDVVAAVVRNGREFWEVSLAAQQIGLYFLPINWHLQPHEVEYILRDSDAKVLIASPEDARRLSVLETLPLDRYSIGAAIPGWHQYQDLGDGYPDSPPEDARAGNYLSYTSGTTGKPKGVKRQMFDASPSAMARNFTDMVIVRGTLSETGAHLVCSPLYHSGPGGVATGSLHLGHTLVLHEEFNAEFVLRDIEKYHVTDTHMVPTHFHRLLALSNEVKDRYDHSSLQVVNHAGAPCPPSLKRRMIEWWGPVIWEYFGSTEGMVQARVSSAEWLQKPGTVGKPAANTVVILDDNQAEVEPGVDGLIYVKSTLPFEYLGDPGKTATSRHGEYVTVGDFGHLDSDGYLYVQDRRSDLIISGGVNVYPAEVEAAFMSHPSVDDIGVFGAPDDEWGQRVVAVIKLTDGPEPSSELRQELIEFSKKSLASYKRPKQYIFVADFPRNAAGKASRASLRQTYEPQLATSVHSRRP
jgi:long-chain acyl-CoA synthetase